MPTLHLLYRDSVPVDDKLTIRIPTVGEIMADEDDYYSLVYMLTAMPVDMMVQLDDIGIDFTQIDEYELFLMLFGRLREQDTSLVFGDLDLAGFRLGADEQNGAVVLIDERSDIVIDRATQGKIAAALRKIHHLEKNRRKPGNAEGREYMLQRARAKQKRHKNKTTDSQLESLIIAMVNTEQFKYRYEEVLDLSIYQFNESVRQIIKKVDYDNRMYGVYTGTINAKDLSQDDLNWLSHK